MGATIMKKKQKPTKLKTAIKELGISDDDTVFIWLQGKIDAAIKVSEITPPILNKPVRVIHKNFGGQEYEYSCYRFILE